MLCDGVRHRRLLPARSVPAGGRCISIRAEGAVHEHTRASREAESSIGVLTGRPFETSSSILVLSPMAQHLCVYVSCMVTVRSGKRKVNLGMEVVDELSLGIVRRAPIQKSWSRSCQTRRLDQ